DGDGGELLQAVEDEIERLRGGEVGEDGVERRLDAEEEGGGQKDDDIERENDIGDAQDVALPADEQGGDLGAIEHRSATDGEADARAEEKPAKHRGEEFVRRDIGEGHGGEA